MKFFIVCVFLLFKSALFSVEALYLTFAGDPSSSMAIHWLEKKKDKKTGAIWVRQLATDKEWKKSSAVQSELSDYLLSRVVLQELKPDTDYEFRLEREKGIYRFRTLPATLSRPIKVALGGDAYEQLAPYQKMNSRVALYNPDFAILGGDTSYANTGTPMPRWVTFFNEWQKTMNTEEGRMIPLIATIGNHDISKKGSFFQDFFPYLDKGSYGKLPVAGIASFFLLDTGHINPIEGKQTEWLKKELPKAAPYRFAIYHVAGYPSVYSPNRAVPKTIRSEWSPLFEDNRVIAAFEHHNHAFKKTYPIKNGKMDPDGVVYLGDGCWSVPPRKAVQDAWYLEKKGSINHFFLLTLLPGAGVEIKAIDIEGNEIDSWMQRR